MKSILSTLLTFSALFIFATSCSGHRGSAGRGEWEICEAGYADDFWWHSFSDTTLDYLVSEAIANNRDLESVKGRIMEARAMVKAEASNFFPDATLSATTQKFRFSENGIFPIGALAQTGLIKEGDRFFDIGFDTRWEIDLFGANCNRVVAARERVFQAIEKRKELMISLAAEVVRYYVELRRDQQLLATLSERRSLQQEFLFDLSSKERAGLISELDINRAIAEEKEIEADMTQYRASINAAMNRLAVLIGEMPKHLNCLLSEVESLPSQQPFDPGAVSAGVILQRPDVKAVEHSLKAEVALVKSARARLMPNLLLFALTRLQSMSLSDLFAQGSRWWFIGPFASWKIFERYELKANLEGEIARFQQSSNEYSQKILAAHEEVDSICKEYQESIIRKEFLQKAESTAENSVQLTGNLYEAGLGSYGQLLQARLLTTLKRENRIKAEAKALIDKARLHKALGGGWKALTLPDL